MIWKSSIVLLVRTSTSRLLNNFSGCPNSTIDTFLNGFTPGQLSQKSSNKCITSSISINNSVIRQSDYLQKIKNKTLLFDFFHEINFIIYYGISFFVKSISSLLFEFFFSVKSIFYFSCLPDVGWLGHFQWLWLDLCLELWPQLWIWEKGLHKVNSQFF